MSSAIYAYLYHLILYISSVVDLYCEIIEITIENCTCVSCVWRHPHFASLPRPCQAVATSSHPPPFHPRFMRTATGLGLGAASTSTCPTSRTVPPQSMRVLHGVRPHHRRRAASFAYGSDTRAQLEEAERVVEAPKRIRSPGAPYNRPRTSSQHPSPPGTQCQPATGCGGCSMGVQCRR
jgi:hypothetical protein